MLVADAHFIQGQEHPVCQDYALAGTTPRGRAWAVVADGCSGSPGTDTGARVLALVAARTLAEGPLEPGRVVRRAAVLARSLGLPPGALDATLLWVAAEGGKCRVGLSGDGLWALRRANGAVEWHHLIAGKSAPRYLSYDLDPARLQAFRRGTENGRHRLRHGRVGADGREERVSEIEGEDPVALEWNVVLEPGDAVAISSDGLASFSGRGGPVPAAAVLGEVLRVPQPLGRFVARRLRRFTARSCAREGWTWADDLGVGMVLRVEGQP